jgi:hypothetical protein
MRVGLDDGGSQPDRPPVGLYSGGINPHGVAADLGPGHAGRSYRTVAPPSPQNERAIARPAARRRARFVVTTSR